MHCHLQYPKVAPPDRHRAVVPRLVLAFLKKRFFSSFVRSGDSRMYSMAVSCSVTYAGEHHFSYVSCHENKNGNTFDELFRTIKRLWCIIEYNMHLDFLSTMEFTSLYSLLADVSYSVDLNAELTDLGDSTPAKFVRIHVSNTPISPRASFLARRLLRVRNTYMVLSRSIT